MKKIIKNKEKYTKVIIFPLLFGKICKLKANF